MTQLGGMAAVMINEQVHAVRAAARRSSLCWVGGRTLLSLRRSSGPCPLSSLPVSLQTLPCETLCGPLFGCGHRCLLRARRAFLSRHVLRRGFAAKFAELLAHASEIFEDCRRHPFGHVLIVIPNWYKVNRSRVEVVAQLGRGQLFWRSRGIEQPRRIIHYMGISRLVFKRR
jgi:hypothetical protein